MLRYDRPFTGVCRCAKEEVFILFRACLSCGSYILTFCVKSDRNFLPFLAAILDRRECLVVFEMLVLMLPSVDICMVAHFLFHACYILYPCEHSVLKPLLRWVF
jgi:hypothetical protein